MQSGTLTRRIQIQTQSSTQDAAGQQVDSWTTAYTCWANISVQNSQLVYSTAEFIEKVTHRITCRWTYSFVFTPKQRIVYTQTTTGVTHTYEVEAVINENQENVSVTLLCYELSGVE